ncbi:unnamed protein product [Sphagnum tenellum]
MVGFLGTLSQGPAKDLLSQRRGGQRSDAGIAGRRSVRKISLSRSFTHTESQDCKSTCLVLGHESTIVRIPVFDLLQCKCAVGNRREFAMNRNLILQKGRFRNRSWGSSNSSTCLLKTGCKTIDMHNSSSSSGSHQKRDLRSNVHGKIGPGLCGPWPVCLSTNWTGVGVKVRSEYAKLGADSPN